MPCARAMLVRPAVLVLLLAGSASGLAAQAAARTDWLAVDKAMGRKGTMNPGDVQKYGFPRSDLRVTVGEVTVKPALALGGWVAFRDAGRGRAHMMGDLVLAADEVGPVMHALEKGGVEISAVHNHLLGEAPRVMYMHIVGRGAGPTLARTIHDAMALTKAPAPAPAAPAAGPLDLDSGAVANALGYAGKVTGGVLQFSIARREPVSEGGHDVPPSMGVATGINFQPTGNGRAAITGDFVLVAGEVNPVIRALDAGGVQVTALHSHMLRDDPRLFFMHFWANDDAVKLATALHGALEKMSVKRQ